MQSNSNAFASAAQIVHSLKINVILIELFGSTE